MKDLIQKKDDLFQEFQNLVTVSNNKLKIIEGTNIGIKKIYLRFFSRKWNYKKSKWRAQN